MYYHFPLISSLSVKAAEAALCAGVQGKFWGFHDLLFEHQPSWSGKQNYREYFRTYAQTLDLDVEQFNHCVESGEMLEVVQQDRHQGKALNVNATPTIFLNNIRIVGARPFSVFAQTIEELLQQ